jgi:DNA-binding transcriptional MerR regulator
MPMMRKLTVSEIAAMVEDAPERRPTLVERIRHWTREGLIRPIGVKNPGTGRHREYDEATLLDVSVLNVFANLGLQVFQQTFLLKNIRNMYDLNKLSVAAKNDIYIIIPEPGRAEVPVFYSVEKDRSIPLKLFAGCDAVVLINVSRIYRNVAHRIKAYRAEQTPKKPRF